MYEIDKTDIGIVNLLLEDGRMSASEMARRLANVSERAIRYRIERMREENILQIGVVVSRRLLVCRSKRMSGWRWNRIAYKRSLRK